MAYWHSTVSQHSLYAYMLSLGLRPGDVLAEAGVPGSAFINSAAWIERDVALQLVRRLAEVISDPLVGLHQGSFYDFDKFGAWGRGIVESSTLGDALLLVSGETHAIQTGTRIHCVRADRRVRLWSTFDGALGFASELHDQAHLMLLRMILDLAEEPVAADVSVGCGRASGGDDFERVFGSRLDFAEGQSYLEFDAAALDLSLAARPIRPVAGGNPGTPDSSLIGRSAFALIRSVIGYERPSIQSISDALGINLRAFQRHLDTLGVTFRQLVDEYRQAYALADLSDGRVSVTETAFRLGYSDSAHFTRAVRRWTGSCPRELRHRPIPPGHWLNRRLRILETMLDATPRAARHDSGLHTRKTDSRS